MSANAIGALEQLADLVADPSDGERLDAVLLHVVDGQWPFPPPARSAPANVNLPRNLLISIEAIALVPAG